ncbi:MAG: sialate O-acetylesterase [Phycisphaerae bacterium]|jgi:sialate O-acetylesterase|nr:sialate O-acetylesterase [Phycisphaerae bacterium]
MIDNIKLITIAMATLAVTCTARAEVRLANIFGNRMVLQCDKPISVWGFAAPGEKVTVRFAPAKGDAQSASSTANAKGLWSVELKAMKPTFEPGKLLVEGKASKTALSDVLIGELWLCGGQSNMEWSLRGSLNADMEIPSADFPNIRFYRMPHIARPKAQSDVDLKDAGKGQGIWRPCVTENVQDCTAVGYYFARRLRRMLKVPVGLIDTSWGGTMAQHWTPRKTLEGFPEMKPYIEKFDTAMKQWTDGGGEEGAKRRYAADLKAWENTMAEARGDRKARKPNSRAYTTPATKRQPGGMFNGMIVPIKRMRLRGVLFYQGENNSFGESWKPFHRTFPAVISSWRKAFGDEKLPFGIIQIAGWSSRRSMTYDMNHHTNVIREIQFLTWRRTPGTGLIVTFDTNSTQRIHPPLKLPVGRRSARWALAEVYGVKRWGSKDPLEWRGPIYKGMKIDGKKIVITFEPESSRSLRLDKDNDRGFYIAGKDRKFHFARARVFTKDKKQMLQVWCDDVPEPVAVRYAWSNLPIGGLENSRHLPAYPFRTDTWALTPHQSTGEYHVDKK